MIPKRTASRPVAMRQADAFNAMMAGLTGRGRGSVALRTRGDEQKKV